MSSHLLTIGITYHNECELLTDCVNSILSQIGEESEILIYDDASSTPAQKYVPANNRIRVIRGEKNLGPARGRNILLAEASGEYIHFHDADDWFAPNWFKSVKEKFGKADAIFTEVTSYRDGKTYLEKVLEVGTLNQEKNLLKFAIESFMLVPCGTYKKSILEKINGYREDLWQSEDWDFHVRMALSNPSFEVIEKPLVFIRIRKESRSQNRIETASDTIKAITLLSSSIPNTHKKYLADKAAQMGSRLFNLGAKEQARNAFKLSNDLGPSTFHWQRSSYQYIARFLGQEYAETAGAFFRKIVKSSS